MKIDRSEIPVAKTHNTGAGHAYKIKNSGTAFEILSSGLYSNKIKAIVRELGCNAYDSHVAAGHPEKPFDVHIPTMLSPTFWIRDYGTGLSHDDVLNIYTTYFESNKTDTNTLIGGMGLGSKAPFSYTRNFSVQSYFNNIVNSYINVLDEDGFPKIIHLGEATTDEPNGLKIEFALNNNNDHYDFDRECKNVFQWFDHKPNVLNSASEIPEIELEQIGDTAAYIRKVKYGSADPVILMGNIAYPIDGHIDYKNVVIKANIGDVHFSASRETLRYTDKTKEYIEKHFADIDESYTKMMNDKFDHITNLYELYSQIYNNRSTDGLNKIFETMQRTYFKNRCTSESECVELTGQSYYSALRISVDEDKIKEFNASVMIPTVENKKFNMLFDGTQKFIFNTGKVGISTRVKKKNNNKNTYMLFNRLDKSKPLDIGGLTKYLGYPPNIETDADYPYIRPYVSRSESIFLLRYNKYDNRHSWKDLTEENFNNLEEKHTIIYVPLAGWRVPDDCIITRSGGYIGFIHTLKALGLDIYDHYVIVGVRKASMDLVENHIHVDDFVKDHIDSLTAEDFVAENISSSFKTIVNNIPLSDIPDDLKNIGKGVWYTNKYHKLPYEARSYLSNHKRLMQLSDDGKIIAENLKNKYALLPYVDYSSESIPHILEYIKHINGKNT